jgi:hypothetical protein
MEIMRDGAVPVAAAFHHFPLSLATDRTQGEILEAAHKVRFEFDPAGTRPFAIVILGKPRAGDASGETHGLLVLGNFDSEGRAIKDGFSNKNLGSLYRANFRTKVSLLGSAPIELGAIGHSATLPHTKTPRQARGRFTTTPDDGTLGRL